mmetsp:Transcript_22104/g.25407  ORF Transcript_22104/g.25407 Transcript_22104/m.25407 type:complete len:126 (-) Transcript_22104:256-633(-)
MANNTTSLIPCLWKNYSQEPIVPRICPHLPQVCVPSWRESTQKGMQQQNHRPNQQRPRQISHCIVPVLVLTSVTVGCLQCGHTKLTGFVLPLKIIGLKPIAPPPPPLLLPISTTTFVTLFEPPGD